jgi:hypothetical protein
MSLADDELAKLTAAALDELRAATAALDHSK